MQTKKIISIALLTIFWGYTSAGCREQYCRKTEDEMFLAAEKQFKEEIDKGVHQQPVTKKNLCDFHLSSIAYGFSIVESGKGKSRIGTQINNRFSVKKGSGTFQYKRNEERGYLKGSRYLKYPDEFLSTLDFMYLFKYGYYCKLSYGNVSVYKTGKIGDEENTRRYYNNLLSSIKYFEKKYFGSNEKIESYKLINPDYDKQHGSAAKQTVQKTSVSVQSSPLQREEKVEGNTKIINISIKTDNDNITLKIKQGTKYAEAIKKSLKGKYSFTQKILLIKRILDIQKKDLELSNYKKDIEKINVVISENPVLLSLNKEKLKSFYSTKLNLPKIAFSKGYSLKSTFEPKNIAFEQGKYKGLIKIISLNMVLGFYKIILG